VRGRASEGGRERGRASDSGRERGRASEGKQDRARESEGVAYLGSRAGGGEGGGGGNVAVVGPKPRKTRSRYLEGGRERASG